MALIVWVNNVWNNLLHNFSILAMKKFLTAITFLWFTAAALAQCINVQITPIKGNCHNDNQIKVVAKAMLVNGQQPSICQATPSSGKFTVEIEGDGASGIYRMSPSPVANINASAEYTFYNLFIGKYKITVRDEVTGTFEEREVDTESNYQLMNFSNMEAIAPTCNEPNTGGIRFRIPSGGIGPFEVSVLDMNRNVIVPVQEFARPTGSNYIEVRGDNAHPLPVNKQFILQVHDKTNTGNPNCGETRRFPSLQIPASALYTVNCIGIKTYQRWLLKRDDNCNYGELTMYLIRPEDGKSLGYKIDDATSFYDFFKRPGTAVLKFLNSSKPTVDFSSNFYAYIRTDDYDYPTYSYYTATGLNIAPGDEVEITIKGPKNTIKERIKFDNQIIPAPTLSINDNSYNYTTYSVNNCAVVSSTTKYLRTYDSSNTGRSASYSDLNTGENRDFYWVSGWTRGYGIITLQRKVGSNWVDEPNQNTPSVAGATYRYIYKTPPPGCNPLVSDEKVIDYPPHSHNAIPTINHIDKVWDYMKIGYGVMEGTGAINIEHYQAYPAFPIQYKIMPADGSTTITYQGYPGFYETQTRTISFPIIFDSDKNPATGGKSWYYHGGRTRMTVTNLPSGNYIIVASDACGRTSTRTVSLPATHYNPKFEIKRDCEVGKAIFHMGSAVYSDTSIRHQLQKKREDQWGNIHWDNVNGALVTGFKGEFPNLLPGDYRITSSGYYYNAFYNGSPLPDATDHAEPRSYWSSYTYYKHFTIKPLEKLKPVVNPIVCNENSNTGMVAVDVTGQEVFFPLEFYLYRLSTATATTGSLVKKVTYQESDNTYHYLFDNLTSGYYRVVVSHRCNDSPATNFNLDIDATFDPFLVMDRPVPFCKGNEARIKLGVSDKIFNINWYRLDSNGNKNPSTPIKTGQSFWEPIQETTSYMAEYSLNPNLGCTNNRVYTKSATIVMPPEDEPPFFKQPCPDDIEVTVDAGQCRKAVMWRVPTGYPTCHGAVTVHGSHNPGDSFPIGTTSVTYILRDPAGLTNTCTFNVIVKSNALKLKTEQRYTDLAGNTITELQANQQFIYELRYKNDGADAINQATIEVKLPDSTTLFTDGNPNLTGTGDNNWQNPYPIMTYSAANKTYKFEIGAETSPGGTRYQSTLKLGDPERVIKIPLKTQADCETLFGPCANYLQTELKVTYRGGAAGCVGAELVTTGTLTATVNTSGCERQEMSCGTGQITFRAIEGFTTYQWYNSSGIIYGQNASTYIAPGPGIYRVVKTVSCYGENLTVTETINYQTITDTTDPIRAQANNIGVVCPNTGDWTSQFYLCNGNSKVLRVNYRNTPFEWQAWNVSCNSQAAGLQAGCRVTDDNCWSTIEQGSTFTITDEGLYRVKLLNSGCGQSFYFQVIKNGLGGSFSDPQAHTDYELGSVKHEFNSSGVSYNVVIYKDGVHLRTDIVTKTEGRIENLPSGNYNVQVSSPQIAGCTLSSNFTIDRVVGMHATATFNGFKSGYCNTAKLNLKAEGGQPTYKFYVWKIDGVQQYPDYATALNDTPIALQLASQGTTGVDVEVPNVTQIGEYEFIAFDSTNGRKAFSNKVTISPPAQHTFDLTVTEEISCAAQPNSGVINMSFGPGSQNLNRTIKLFQLKKDGTRSSTSEFRSSPAGLFTSLPAGTYEIEMTSKIAGNTCKYIKKPVVILAPQSPLRGYAGVVADRSCDTQNNQYKVAINNVSGGKAPYKYSFDGENTYVNENVGFVSASGNVYVKDDKDCKLTLSVTTEMTEIPTITLSPVSYRCDNGYGAVTITISANSSQTYEYILDGSATITLSGDKIFRTLSPGVHSFTLFYRPSDSQTTPNVLFEEDFGTLDSNDCLGTNTGLVCNNSGTNLLDGQHVVTQQAPAMTGWTVPTSTGRYLAIAGNGAGEVVYKRKLSGVTMNTPLTVSVDAINMLTGGGVQPRMSVALCRVSDGVALRTKQLGFVTNSWQNLSVTFNESEVAGFTGNELELRLLTSSGSSYGIKGNDYAIDNIKVEQPTKYCEMKLTQLINIAANKEMRVEKYGAEKNVSCIDSQDGQVRVKVINAPTNQVKYAVEWTYTTTTTWTQTTLDADGVFTVTGLEVNNNGRLRVQSADYPSCITTLPYSIGAPAPIVPTVTLMERVTCFSNGKAKIKASATGGTGNYKYQVGLVNGSLGAAQPSAHTPNPYEISSLVPGTYSLVVIDENNCKTSTTFVIADKAVLSATASPESYCYNTGSDKKVLIEVTTGNGNYKVRRVGGNSYTFDAGEFLYPEVLQAGSHTFVLTDGFGCMQTLTTEVYAPMALVVSPTAQLYAACTAGTQQFDLSVTGGIPTMDKTFSYSTDGGVTFTHIATATTQATLNMAVPAGEETTVQFRVSYKPNGTECRRERLLTINYDPPRFLGSTFTLTKAICGNDNGSVLITPNDYYVGTASHSLVVKDTNGVVQTVTAMAAGNYIAYLTDARGCVATRAFTIDKVEQVSATVSITKQMGCQPQDKAELTVYLRGGGKTPYSVKVLNTSTNSETTQTSISDSAALPFGNLEYGGYNISITDGNGCEVQLQTVVNPSSSVMSITFPTPMACSLNTYADIKATSTGTFTSTTRAYFAVYRTGIQNPPAGSAANFVQTTNLDGTTDTWYLGTASGTGVVARVPNLTPGVNYTFVTYNMTTGCRFVQNASVAAPTSATLTGTIQVKNVTCADASNGTFTFTLTGGWNTLATQISWKVLRADNHQQPATSGTITGNMFPSPGWTTPQFVNAQLPAGKYYLQITQYVSGVASCVSAFNFEVKRSPLQLNMSTSATRKATCNRNGQMYLEITGGTATYTYGYIDRNTPYTPAMVAATVSATTLASKYVDIPDGVWDVYVSDHYGCLQSNTVTITKYDTPNVSTVTTLACRAYNNTNGKIPVRIDLNQIGEGAHYYSLDGSASAPVNWTVANQSFEVEVTPLVAHTITITDVNGCSTSKTFSTTAIITATATVIKLKTCASPTAEVRVDVSGGTGTYTYNLERLDNGAIASETLTTGGHFTSTTGGVIVLGTPTLTLAATYRISIYDAETTDCPIVKEVTVQDPDPINMNNVIVKPYHEKCNKGLTATGTGSIDIAMPLDTDSYTFSITTAIDLTTGNAISVTTTPAVAGTHSATFRELHGTPRGVRYDIMVKNSTGCVAGVTTIVTSPEMISFEDGVITATQYLCENGGALSAPKVVFDVTKVKGGVPSYTYEFVDAATGVSLGNGSEYTLPNLAGGTYYVKVKDASGSCETSTVSVTVVPAFELTGLSVTTTTSATCVVDEVIRITVSTTGYIAGTDLKYIVQGTDNSIATITTVASTTVDIPLVGSKNLKGSNYTVEVVNMQTGCNLTGVHKVKDPNTFAIESSNAVRAVCNDDYGSITLSLIDKDLSDGDQAAAGFTYTITAVSGLSTTTLNATVAGGTVVTITGQLVGGSYDIVATSLSTGCEVAKHRFTIPANPAAIEIVRARQEVSVDCNNQNAVAKVYLKGGEGTFTVTLTPIGGTPGAPIVKGGELATTNGIAFDPLNAGSYQITLEDSLGCTRFTGSNTVDIDPYDAINVSSITVQVTSITCVDANDGKLKVSNVTGGTRPYAYKLVRLSATGTELPSITENGNTYTFEGIEPGTYRVDVIDSKSCSVTVAGTYTFADPQPLSADIDESASQFYTCKGENTGNVTIHNIAGGTGTYHIDIVRDDNDQKVAGVRDLTGTSYNFADLPPIPDTTFYRVVIEDTNHCVMTKTVSFTVVQFPDITVRYIEQEGTCEANTNNYKDYLVVKFLAPTVDFSKITYSLNHSATSTTFVRTIGSNIGIIEAYDRETVSQTIEIQYTTTTPILGSCTSSKSFDVELRVPLTLTNTTSSATAINTIEVKAEGGRTNNLHGYTYYYNGVDRGGDMVYTISHKDPERVEANGLRIKIVNVEVRDADGCTATLTLEVPYHDIEVPNFFTPDGDGENDEWKPKYLDNNVNARIYIFDRYGRRIANLAPGEGWDGTYEGLRMPSGDYWYIIEINDELYDKRQFYGNFTLYR